MKSSKIILTFSLLLYSIACYSNNYLFINSDSCSMVDIIYKNKTIHFEKDGINTSAYVKELYNDSIRPNDNLTPTEYNYSVSRFLQDSIALKAIDSIQDIVKTILHDIAINNNRITVCTFIDEYGKVIGAKFIYNKYYNKAIDAEDIYRMTTNIINCIKFTPPQIYGCNIIQLYIPILNHRKNKI